MQLTHRFKKNIYFFELLWGRVFEKNQIVSPKPQQEPISLPNKPPERTK